MAAKGLKTLIRLSKWEVDEKRKVLQQAQSLEDAILAAIKAAEQQLILEQRIAAQSAEAGYVYGAYASAWLGRREELFLALKAARHQVELAQDDLAESFRKQKALETTQAARDRREKEEADRKEQASLDDLGLEIYRRREE